MSKPKVSVIIPVYNNEDYLDKCLSSVCNQTLSEIEIICINDESTDSSLDILNVFKSKDERISVYSQNNQGAGASRNRGIELAQGEYISFVDADDWLEQDALEKLYDNAVSNDSDMVLFNSIERKAGDETRDRIYMPIDESIDYNNFVFDYKYNRKLVMNSMLVIWSKIYKTSFLNENDLRFYNHRIFNDMQFHIESMILSERISYLPEILYNYNKLNENSLQTSVSYSNKRLLIFKVCDGVKEFLISQDIYDEFKANFTRFKLTESQVNLEKSPANLKDDFYTAMRNEFLRMDVDAKLFKELPQRFYDFFIKVLNCQTYGNFELYNSEANKARINFIDKEELSGQIESFTELGINPVRDENSIIVSLTSFPDRMEDIHYGLYSLLTQNLKPHKVILWLGEDKFPNKEKDLPKEVLDLMDNGLTVEWCRDIRSYTKIIPTLRKYPDYYIVTADDDIFYPSDWLEQLWDMHEKYPKCVIASRARKVIIKNNEVTNYNDWPLATKSGEPSFLNFLTGVGGVLYFPNAFTKIVLDEELFMKLSPFGDDIWLWAMLVISNVRIKLIENPISILIYVNLARETGVLNRFRLWDANEKGFNDVQIRNVFDYFPQIEEILLND